MTINHGYKILHKYTIEEIFNTIEKNKTLPDEIVYGDGELKNSIKRIQIIQKLLNRDGFKCMGCDIIPSYFALGKDKGERWHLDLYGISLDINNNKHDHMFTIDHVHPKSKGGDNKIENYQLLCKICNEKKGDKTDDDVLITKKDIKKTYIEKRITSLTEQIKGTHKNIMNKKVICIKEQNGFTVGKEYKIIDVKIRINKKNNVVFQFISLNDDNEQILSPFDNFLTKVDYIKIKKNK